MDMDYNNQKSYSKKNLWKWVLLYVVIGFVVYGLMYYFFFTRSGGYRYDSWQYQPQDNVNDQTTPAVKNDQDLISASQSLDATNVNQLDNELNQNDVDADAF